MLLHHPASILQVFLMQMSVQNDCTDVIVQVLFLRLVTMDLRVLHHVHEHGLRSPSSRKHAVLAWVESTESASARRLTTRTLLVSIFGVWIRRCQPASRPAGQPAVVKRCDERLRFASLRQFVDQHRRHQMLTYPIRNVPPTTEHIFCMNTRCTHGPVQDIQSSSLSAALSPAVSVNKIQPIKIQPITFSQ